jgi:ribosomal protein S20
MARKAIKRFDLATLGKDKDVIQSTFNDAERILRRVVGKGIYKHQTANRTISRLAHKRNQALGSK